MRHRSKARATWIATAALLLAAGALSDPAPRAAGKAAVRAVPSRGTIGVGETVTVSFRIAGARDVGSVPFTVLFDPSLLEFVAGSAVEGPFLRSGGAATSFLAAPGPASRGGGVVIGLSRLGGSRGAKGKGLLCRLTFRSRAPGTASLEFARAQLLDPDAHPLEAAFQGVSIHVRPSR